MHPVDRTAAIIGGVRRLFPAPADPIGVRAAYDVPRPRPAGRPWITLCMVASVDGSTVVDQRSSSLSSPADTEVLLTLRSFAQIILVGAATVRLEGYGPPRIPGQRVGVVSRRGEVDLDRPLFTSGAGFLVLPEDAPELPVETVRAGIGRVDLAAAVARLDADVVQAEGGAALNAALADADLLDEVDLTVSPQLVGGDGPRVVQGAPPLSRPMRLAHVLEDDGFLFTRYVRAR